MRSGKIRWSALLAVLAAATGLSSCDLGPHLLYGFIDEQGQWAVAPEYTDALPPAEGLVPVRKGDAWGFVDTRGRSIVEPQFTEVRPFAEGLAAVRSGSDWRFIDRAGRTVIAGPYDEARRFDGGLAAVRVGKRWGFVDHAGRLVIEPRFEELAGGDESRSYVPCFRESLCAARQDGKWGFMDRSGVWVIAARFAEAGSFHEGLAAVREAAPDAGGGVGFINRRGEMVIAPRFAGGLWFSGGRAVVTVDRRGNDARDEPARETDLKAVLIDAAGKEIADVGWEPVAGVFDAAHEALSALAPDYLGEGLVPASEGDRWGFMDRDGAWVIPPGFSLVLPFRNGVAPAGLSDDPDADPWDVQRWGLIDARGKWVVEPRLSAVGPWGGAYTWARRHTRWGLIDRDGDWRVEPVYADADEWFDLPGLRMRPGEGLQRAGVYANHRWAVVDRQGRRSSAVELEWLEPVATAAAGQTSRRLAYLERGLWGIADEKLKLITPALFDEKPGAFDRRGRAQVSQDGWWGCIDLAGRWVVRPQSSEVRPCGDDEGEPGDGGGEVDERGTALLRARYEEVGAMRDGLYAVRLEGKWGIADGRGRELFAPTFERAMPFNRDVAVFCEGKLCGLAARTGEVIVPPTYSAIAPLSGRLAVTMMLQDDGRMESSGVIDAAGGVMVAQEYYTIESYSGHLLMAWDARGHYRLLQKSNGQPPPGLPDIAGRPGKLSEGLAAVDLRTADGTAAAGYIDARGQLLIAPRFDAGKAGVFEKGVAIVSEGGRCGTIDKRGKSILPAEYQHCQRLPDGRILFAEEAPVRITSPPPAEAGVTPPAPGSSAS